MSTLAQPTSRIRTIHLVYCALFATLMMIGANSTSFIPFLVVGGVPITLQTFFAVLAGLLLGSRLGPIAMLVYICIGLAGAPVFSKFTGGPYAVLLPTFGFLLSFVVLAYVVGKLAERATSVKQYIFAALVGLVINYFIGTNWMYFAYRFWANVPEAISYQVAWAWMIPPLPKDIILSVLAGIVAFRLKKVIKIK